jgi:hypothetical protein
VSPTPNWASQGSACESALSVPSLVAATTLVALLASLYPGPWRLIQRTCSRFGANQNWYAKFGRNIVQSNKFT